MKSLLLLLSGLVLGLWISWPWLVIINNWKSFKNIIEKSSKEQISFKAALAVSPNYTLNGNRNKNNSKIRVVFDPCFR